MEKPTFISSGPDALGRTICFGDENSRRASYGRIHPMTERRKRAISILRFLPKS